MKGASPVPRKRQAELELDEYLKHHLDDADGALRVVLLRRVTEGRRLLEASYEEPLAALRRVIIRLLEGEERLHRFVDEVDAEWGRMYSERPFFERGDSPPRPRDPYTWSSVGRALERLLDELAEG